MKFITKNNFNIALENIKDTPRCAIYLYLSTPNKIKIGADVLLGNLLLQGTPTKTAEQIASELEKYGIEISIDSNTDYLRVSILCLNEDIEKAMELTCDFMQNANFETFNKEVSKFKGEVDAILDAPQRKASDKFYREIFENHKYGITNTKILEEIDNLTKEDVINYYKEIFQGKKIISIAGDFKNEENFINLLVQHFPFMKNNENANVTLLDFKSEKSGIYKIEKEDAKQAQIFQGWIVEGLLSKDCAALNVLNNILGASGLSSRLFVELRDKQGLAYTVRSSYKTLKDGAAFLLYIGTEPSNIKKSLDGFRHEIERIIKEPPLKEELDGAKESYSGKYKYLYTQTNAQIARGSGWNFINGLDFDYNEKLLKDIFNVTSDDIVNVVKKYLLKPPVTVVLAPKEYLDF